MTAQTPKARRLQELASAGIPVPPTIVVPDGEVKRLAATYLAEGINAAAGRLLELTPSEFFPLALRSSYGVEDSLRGSFAGAFTSIIGVPHESHRVAAALRTVLDEYLLVVERAPGSALELVLQPQVDRTVHGVLFTIDPEGGSEDFFVISTTADREDITAGARSQTAYVDKASLQEVWGDSHLGAAELATLIDGANAAQKLFPGSALDIEFGALGQKLFFFQVRPVTAVVRKEERWFHSSSISDIAPPYKHVFSRHRAKRHQIYSVFAESSDVLFPRSLVVSKASLSQGESLARRGIRTSNVLTVAAGVVAPQRKEDFKLMPLSELEEHQPPCYHLLVTEAPDAKFSGHLLATAHDVVVEWTEGPLSGFNSGSHICRSNGVANVQTELNSKALLALCEGMREHFPGSVAEWIQDHAGRLWIYDATLNTGVPAPLMAVQTGSAVALTASQIAELGELRRYPMSVNGEDDYMDDALMARIVEIVPQLAVEGSITVCSEYPAIELAILSLLTNVKEFQVVHGSILCHLALIAREKGKLFTIASA